MADRDFRQPGDRGLERAQVRLAEVMPGVDGQAGLLRPARRVGAARPARSRVGPRRTPARRARYRSRCAARRSRPPDRSPAAPASTNRLTRQPRSRSSPTSGRSLAMSRRRSKPWSEVIWPSPSGTRVTWVGRTSRARATRPGIVAACARRTGCPRCCIPTRPRSMAASARTSSGRTWRWSGRGCTVIPPHPASMQVCAACADVGFVATARIAQHGDLVEVDAEQGHGGRRHLWQRGGGQITRHSEAARIVQPAENCAPIRPPLASLPGGSCVGSPRQASAATSAGVQRPGTEVARRRSSLTRQLAAVRDRCARSRCAADPARMPGRDPVISAPLPWPSRVEGMHD